MKTVYFSVFCSIFGIISGYFHFLFVNLMRQKLAQKSFWTNIVTTIMPLIITVVNVGLVLLVAGIGDKVSVGRHPAILSFVLSMGATAFMLLYWIQPARLRSSQLAAQAAARAKSRISIEYRKDINYIHQEQKKAKTACRIYVMLSLLFIYLWPLFNLQALQESHRPALKFTAYNSYMTGAIWGLALIITLYIKFWFSLKRLGKAILEQKIILEDERIKYQVDKTQTAEFNYKDIKRIETTKKDNEVFRIFIIPEKPGTTSFVMAGFENMDELAQRLEKNVMDHKDR